MSEAPTTKSTMAGNAAYSKLGQAEEGLVVAEGTRKEMKPFAIATTETEGQRPTPPGVREGGVWGTNTYFGPLTRCASIGCCLFCGGISACIVCCMPYDKRRAYLIDHMVCDEDGVYIGGEGEFVDEDFDGEVNKKMKVKALVTAGSVGSIFSLLYLYARFVAN